MEDDRDVRLRSLKTVGLVSYLLHLIVAVGALLPGGQWGPTLLIVALVLDFVRRDDAHGTWHESHFRWRIRTVVVALVAYLVTMPLWLFFLFRAMSPGRWFQPGSCIASSRVWSA